MHWSFQTGCPDDEPYRVLLMAIRRRLYKTRVHMERLYLASTHETTEPEDDPTVYTSAQVREASSARRFFFHGLPCCVAPLASPLISPLAAV